MTLKRRLYTVKENREGGGTERKVEEGVFLKEKKNCCYSRELPVSRYEKTPKGS
jgi:hypothetical protein